MFRRLAPLTASASLLIALAACGSELGGGAPDALDTGAAEVVDDAADDLAPGPDLLGPDVPAADVEGDALDAAEPADGRADAQADTPDAGRDATEPDTDAAPSGPCDGLAEGTACDDGNACTLDDRCLEGLCQPLAPRRCDDDNACTDDTCDPLVGCVHLSNLAACEDGDPCTVGDRCSVGRCRPGGPACDDGNPCTRDLCAPDGTCSNIPDDELPCEDASACTSGDFCAGGVCIAGLGDGCAEDDPCVARQCAADGLACVVALLDGVGCDDGDACTTGDRCQGGLCRAGSPLTCPWDSECAAFRCDRVRGCQLDTVYQAGKSCSDNDRCTLGETCDGAGVCAPLEPAACDDANPCTEDSCDASWGCEHTWVNGPCDDASACTTDDACQYGQCRGTSIVCDDQDACTVDSCDPLVGCQRVPLVCDDGNSCTTDTCDRQAGCRHTARTGACEDGLACTVLETCVGGRCVVGATTCDDDDPCTVDVCDPEEGCVNAPLAPCPLGALRVTAVGVNASPSGLGQWVAIANDGAARFDLDGYALRAERCDCEAVIDGAALVEPGATAYGLRASSPSPQPADLAPGGPASADAFDFVFGAPGDGFRVDPGGDRVELVGPGGEVIDVFIVTP